MRTSASFLASLTILLALVLVGGVAQADTGWRLPWRAGQQVYVTQDCNDSCCSDHVGHNEYAWDFATNGAFDVVAPRAGTIVHVKMSSRRGGDASAVDTANYLVIDHGDGTASIFLHLANGSLDPEIHCGSFVRQGQRLAVTGATGWASGNHLHFQVNRIPPTMNRTCECGPDGMACGESEAHWDLFWSRDAASTSVPIDFDDWHGASSCADRHDDLVLTSRNVDTRDSIVAVDANAPGRFVPLRGAWELARGGVSGQYHAASSGNEASALVPFSGLVSRPGVYEVWTSLPAERRNVGAAVARAEVIARGERASQMQRQNAPGGGYRPLSGRFKLTGRAGEGIVLSAFAREAESLSVDDILLRRVADVGQLAAGHACTSSSECSGDMVCAGSVCRAGCDTGGCGAGETCDATGLCLRPANDRAAPTEMVMTRDWDPRSPSTVSTAASTHQAPPRPAARPTGGGTSDRSPAAQPAPFAPNRAPRSPRDASIPWFGALVFGSVAFVKRWRR